MIKWICNYFDKWKNKNFAYALQLACENKKQMIATIRKIIPRSANFVIILNI